MLMSEGASKMDLEFDFMAAERDLVLAIGTFDGVHLGHRYLVQQVVRRAEERGWLGGAMTFHPPSAGGRERSWSSLSVYSR